MKNSLKALLGRTQLLASEAGRVCAEVATRLAPRLPANDEGVLSEQALGVPPPSLRTALWRAAGLRLGQGANILGELNIKGDGAWRDNLSFGAGTRVTGQLNVELAAPIEIGEGVQIGDNVTLRTTDDEGVASELHVGDGASLCAGCTVMPGVSIGKRAIVAPGAVVTEDVPESVMVAGSPARVVLQLDETPESGVVSSPGADPEHAGPETARSPGVRAAS